MPTSLQFDNLRQEFRRGALPLAVLAACRREFYGYTLRQDLVARGLDIEESTLYPLLRRLETQGLLTSEWREEDRRRKRFYLLSEDGRFVLAQLEQEWRALNQSLEIILTGETIREGTTA